MYVPYALHAQHPHDGTRETGRLVVGVDDNKLGLMRKRRVRCGTFTYSFIGYISISVRRVLGGFCIRNGVILGILFAEKDLALRVMVYVHQLTFEVSAKNIVLYDPKPQQTGKCSQAGFSEVRRIRNTKEQFLAKTACTS